MAKKKNKGSVLLEKFQQALEQERKFGSRSYPPGIRRWRKGSKEEIAERRIGPKH